MTPNNQELRETFGVRIKLLRLKKHLSQEELAKKLGIAKSSLASYETFKTTPDIFVLDKAAKYFNVPYDFFFDNVGNRTTNPTQKVPTGLTDKAIEALQIISAGGEKEILAVVNYILEEFRGDMDIIRALGSGIESGYSAHFLVKLSKYLNTTAKGEGGHFCVSAGGEFIDAQTKPPEKIKALNRIEDKTGVCIISKDELINKLLFDDVVDALKELKRTYHGQPTEAFTRSAETEKEDE